MSDEKTWTAEWEDEKIIWTTCKKSEFVAGYNVHGIEGSDMLTFESERHYQMRMDKRAERSIAKDKIRNAENRALAQANRIARNLGF